MEIEKGKFYTARFIALNGWLPWIHSTWTLTKWIKNDIEKNNNDTFRAIVKGSGRGTRYLIQGEQILRILEKANSGGLVVDQN